ncbi:helix-turn-helix domain-containing protein [Hyphomonas oceanitis]|uniref:XRE family transcriptional regulator n=1 Tax=Hyphomonas oceanitis SCH89 TaxID=1280953 RepID=A0A059G623_9PROT|nr:helix-turn-helix transcriptional regulator [Hyphomonas oceanitis]KDA01883.1 XRE family transcriptional regulator [Hyphomonas oceanitis SCH89]
MTHKVDFATSSSQALIEALCKRLDEIRLSRNISQADLADEAGVSRSTLTRLADGQSISLDSFIRIMQALRLTDHLAALLPDPAVRPVDRVRLDGGERQRASSKRSATAPWAWGDTEPDA